jgi:hypothetical protein
VTGARQRIAVEALPRRELLETLAHSYQHLHNEHTRASPGSGVRRRIEERLLDARERFDRVLDEWVPEPELREAWREHLHTHAPAPAGPPAIRPLVFRGTAEASGSVVEVRGRTGDELAVEIDGSLVERVAAEKDLAVVTPPARLRVDGFEFEETFGASAEALDSLADFLDDGDSAPWDYAEELLGDGLIDTHFAVTARGRRALTASDATRGR